MKDSNVHLINSEPRYIEQVIENRDRSSKVYLTHIERHSSGLGSIRKNGLEHRLEKKHSGAEPIHLQFRGKQFKCTNQYMDS
jgi:hypothetical protein